MLDGERSIVSGHLSEMLSGNWVARPFGTFFKHASAFHKVLGDGHWHLLAERPGFCSRSEKISACVQSVCRRSYSMQSDFSFNHFLLLKWPGNSGSDAHEKSRSWAVRVWLDDDLAVAGRNLQRASILTRHGVIQ